MNETKTAENWFARRAKEMAKKDIIPPSERAGNIVGVAISFLILLYFIAHQTGATGFFTSEFGTLEIIFFYGILVFGLVSSALQGMFGRKNIARLFDVFGGIFGAVATIYLFNIFPFDFTFLADVLPDFLKFLLQWISNDVARVLMVIGIIAALIMAAYNAIFYVLVRRELSKS